MRTDGPEYRNGWRSTIDIDGQTYTLMANHYTRRRMPRGHEISRQIGRGRPLSPVDDPEYEWRLYGPRLHTIAIRPTPSGGFFVAGRFHHGLDLTAVVRDWLENRFGSEKTATPTP